MNSAETMMSLKRPVHFFRRAVALFIDWVVLALVGLATVPLVLGERAEMNITAILGIGYYVTFTTLRGQTVGKQLAGLRVQTKDGTLLTWRRSVVRALPAVPPWLVYEIGRETYGNASIVEHGILGFQLTKSLAMLVALGSALNFLAFLYSKQARQFGGTWHDVFAGSIVVKTGR